MKVTKETVIRTVVFVLAMVNQILTRKGYNPLPFSEERTYIIVSDIVMYVAAIWAWWKNNSFTPEALEGDEYMRELKAHKKATKGL